MDQITLVHILLFPDCARIAKNGDEDNASIGSLTISSENINKITNFNTDKNDDLVNVTIESRTRISFSLRLNHSLLNFDQAFDFLTLMSSNEGLPYPILSKDDKGVYLFEWNLFQQSQVSAALNMLLDALNNIEKTSLVSSLSNLLQERAFLNERPGPKRWYMVSPRADNN